MKLQDTRMRSNFQFETANEDSFLHHRPITAELFAILRAGETKRQWHQGLPELGLTYLSKLRVGNCEIGQKPTSFQNSHNLLKLQASDCWLFWCFVVSHGLMRDSNPKSRNPRLNTQERGAISSEGEHR